MPPESGLCRLALLLAGSALAGAAAAQGADPQPPAPHRAPRVAIDADDDEIVVKGQKPVGSVVGDIPPEQTLSPADVRAYGVDSISDLLDQLSPQTTSIRGRGGEAPVVLLNGRRISSFAEIRDLPTEAILRVEILPEEVALKYGFTADQKVVNFVLRQRFRSRSVAANGGTTTEGGGANGNLDLGLVRILHDDRFSVDGKVQESDRLLESQRGLASTAADGTDLAPYRTLRPRSRTATLNTVYARPLGKAVSASINLTVTATDSRALQGLPGASLAVPAGSPFGNAASLTTIQRTIGTDPLSQYSRSVGEHLGASVNGVVKDWRWNLTGNFDHADSLTRSATGFDLAALQARLEADDPAVDPLGDLTPYVGRLLTDSARSTSNGGNLQLVTYGKLATLPAGSLSTSIKVGGTFAGLDSHSARGGSIQDIALDRRQGNGQINLDVPIASKKNGFLGVLGKLTANANIAVNRLSDFGTLRTYGYGLNWTPRPPLTLIASFTDDQAAPTVQQLGNPAILTAQTRVFDYLRGTTADVVAISGGNPNLAADDRRVMRIGATWKPLAKADLNVSVNYVRSRIRDAIATLPEPTADLENAFPDRFVRDAAGTLIRIDTRATNLSSERQQTLRWGFNLSIPLKPSQAAIDAFRAAMRARFAGGANPFQRPPGAPEGEPPPPPPPDGSGDGARPRPNGDFGPRGGGGGFGGGGFGGGRGGQRFRDNAGGRLQLTVYHSWTLEDQVLIRPGLPVIDLLHGGSVSATGGQPRHQIDAQLGYSNNGIGARLSETWRSGTRVDAAAASATGDLRFSSLATTDLRLFVNVGQLPRFIGADWARNLRVTFAVTNVFDQRQTVRDALGVTPIRYQGPYLDPTGRAVMIGIRKLFSPLPVRRAPPAS